MLNKNIYLKRVFQLTLVVYCLLMLYFRLTLQPGTGDESLFLQDLDFIKQYGWIDAIKHQISIPFLLLVFPFTFIVKNYIALRLTNLLLNILFFLYLYKRFDNKYFWVYLFFYITTTGSLLMGTNDALILLSLSVFFLEVFFLITFKKVNYVILYSSLVIGFFTREMFIIYIPAILIGMYFVLKNGEFNFKHLFFPSFFFLFFLILNIPSISHNGKLSYDNKETHSNVTWTQRQYLSQIRVNEGKLENFQHVSWEETSKYLEINGENSLPKTTFQSIYFDFSLTIKEFFKDFLSVLLYSIRQTGLIVLFSLFSLFFAIKKNKIFSHTNFIPLISFLMISIFSFIIISYVELRWLIPIGILSIIYYSYKQHVFAKVTGNKIEIIFNLNYIVIFTMMLYGIYRLFSKFYI